MTEWGQSPITIRTRRFGSKKHNWTLTPFSPEYVDAMWRMLQQETPEDFVVATGKLSSLEEFVAAAFAAKGLDWHAHVSFDPTLARPTDLAGFAGDARRATERLGWTASVRMPEVAKLMAGSEP